MRPAAVARIERRIFIVRGHRVMLDSDLAEFYGVPTRMVARSPADRHRDRFPADFAFRLAPDEFERLRSQIGISKKGRGGRRYRPWVFTQEGVAMLSGVLRSGRAAQVNIQIMRAFVRLRGLAAAHVEFGRELQDMVKEVRGIREVFEVLRPMAEPLREGPEKEHPRPRRRIGFTPEDRGR